jgi:hypothetical protein
MRAMKHTTGLASWLALTFVAANADAAPTTIRAAELFEENVGIASVDEHRLEIDLRALADAGAVELVLPDGVFTAKLERIDTRKAGFTWRGRIHGGWDVLLTQHDGAISGLIYTPWVQYEVLPGPGGPRLAMIDPAMYPECAQEDAPSVGGKAQAAQTAAVAGDVVDIDVMVVYTPQARDGAGGTAQIQSTIQAAVDITNTAYANSGVDVRLNLVHVQQIGINDSNNSSTDLNNLRNNSTVQNLRNTHGADLVSMIVESNGACGIGYVQRTPGASFAPFGFQVTTRSCAVGNLSFAHEFGHNQGCEHDPANGTSPSSASYPYAFGHFHSGAYRTVMSYSNQCTGGCARAPYFSNPNVSHQGLATGIANQRENFRTINNTAAIVAAFRPSAVPFVYGTATRSQADGATFYTQSMTGAPANPIVVMGPPSFGGSQPAVMRVQSVSASSFSYQLEEWDYLDGGHVSESVGWWAMGSGNRQIGTLAAQAGSRNLDHDWVTVNLSQSFPSAPVVLAQVASRNGGQAVTVRIRNVSATSFQMRLQEEEGNDGTHTTESVHWIAIQRGTTTVAGRRVVVGRTGNSVTDAWSTVSFANSVNTPSFFAAMQTFDGSDPAAVRYRNLGTSSVQVKVEEEASGDAEVGHTTEQIGYVVIGVP